jgi:hypothetical protein
MKNLWLAGLFLFGGCKPVDVTDYNAEEIDSIEIFPINWKEEGTVPESTKTTDPAIIRQILQSLLPVEKVPNNNIGILGRILIVPKKNNKHLLYFIAGDDPIYYEYGGMGNQYRIDRAKFEEALKKMGIDWLNKVRK